MEQLSPHFLTETERNVLQAAHRLERDKRICDRMKAILMLDRGRSYEQIATDLLLEENTIKRYDSIYREKGKEALLTLDYSGKAMLVKEAELEELRDYVEKYTPASAAEAAAFVRGRFGKEYSPSGMVALLHRIGFVYKKPRLIPGKADAEKQEQFLEEIRQIEAELAEEDEILYMDGVHPQHNTKAAYGWFRKGGEEPIKANSGRERMNLNGALHAEDLEVFINESDSVNAQSTISLLQDVEKKYPHAKRILILCDNARYYRSKMVKDYVKQTRIEIKFLPPYAPNLNLIERVWRFMNKKVRDNKYYEKFREFRNAILDFFKNISIYKDELARLLVKRFQIIRV